MADGEKEGKYVGEINKSKNPTAIIMVLIIIAIILGIGMISKSCKTENTNTRQKIIDPVAQMEKQLGSRWEKIEMAKGKWYGPYPLREGSGWRIAQGKIWVKEGTTKPYLDSADIYRCESAMEKSVVFSSYTKKAVLFFKH